MERDFIISNPLFKIAIDNTSSIVASLKQEDLDIIREHLSIAHDMITSRIADYNKLHLYDNMSKGKLKAIIAVTDDYFIGVPEETDNMSDFCKENI